MPPSTLLAPPGRSGTDAPRRLVQEAARIFAEKGFEAASTREICLAANANVAAIHYHFGDKSGLYRAVLQASIAHVVAAFPATSPPPATLAEALRSYLRAFLQPLGGDIEARWYARIHLRESLDPTPVLEDLIGSFVLPHYQQLVDTLAHHCGARQADDELHRLAFAIMALINDYCLSQHWMKALAPGLLEGEDVLDRTLERLTGYACALVAHETQRRTATAPPPIATCRS